MIGYQTIVHKDVRISIDLTTVVNEKMEEAPVAGQEVLVVADRPLIQKEVTAWQSRINETQLRDIPLVDLNDALVLQTGVSKDAAGNLHIRGGRKGEIAYLIDGVYVDDPLNSGFNSELEGSGQTRETIGANLGFSIGEQAIDEVQVISGTFNAEYGRVMSGVVNIVTKSPGARYKGDLQVIGGYLNNFPYRKPNSLVEDKNPVVDAETGSRLNYSPPSDDFQGYDAVIPAQGQFEASLSGPIPGIKPLSFFVSGKQTNYDSYLPHGFNLRSNIFGKLNLFATPTLRFNYVAKYGQNDFQIYSHSWKYLRDNQGLNQTKSWQHIFSINHVLSSKSFYNLNFSYSDLKSEFGIYDWTNNRFKDPETEYQKGERDNELEFYIRGTDDLYLRSKSQVYSAKGDLSYQAGIHHEFKTGFEFRSHNLTSLQRLEPWPDEGGANRTILLDENPIEGAVYFQDKMEYDYVILNAGLRYDFVDVRGQAWEDITNPLSPLKDVPLRSQLSPRLGMAFPISESVVFHFSYGHFFQFPSFADVYANLVYQDPERISEEAVVLVGNPGIKPQRTVSYEGGFKYQFSPSSSFKVSGYYRSLTDLLGTRFYRQEIIYQYSVFTNVDYGSVSGVDLSFQLGVGRSFTGLINYTLSRATGNSSFPTQQAFNAYFELPEAQQEYPLDFDRRHILNTVLNFFYPRKANASFLDAILANTNLNFVIQYASGYPYTPVTDDPTLFIAPNSARMPWTGMVDMKLEKRFNLAKTRLGIFLEVTNLFDRLNALRVQPFTGRLWDTGKLELLATGTDFVHNPSDAAPPRLVRLGLKFSY
jgi:outer membrane receptor protein involved in Fe transport